MAGIATLIVLFWTFLFFKYKNNFDEYIVAIDKKKFPLPDIFFIGFGVITLFHINLKTLAGRKKRKKIVELYGEKYADYYRFVTVGAQITYALTLIPLGLLFGAIANNIALGLLIVFASILLVVYLDYNVKLAVDKRHEEMLEDYPELLSQLTLLINAGMIVKEAWDKVAKSSERPLYKEMQEASIEMQNGVSELDAIYNYSQRCSIKEVRKFASVLIQNLQKGGSELAESLKRMTTESWDEKKENAKRKGELASQKLLLPVMLMFIGILIMIIVPIFTNIFG